MSREISPKDALTVWKLYRLFVRERPDIIHTHTAKAGTVGRLAGLLYRWLTPATIIGRPRRFSVVHTYHGHIFHSYYGPLKTRIFLTIEKVLARIATQRIVVISPQQFREINGQFGVGRPHQFKVIPLGIDTRVFADRQRRRHLVREELGASESDVLVGIVGRLTEVKNHALFLRAAARFKETVGTKEGSRRRVCFVIIGDGHLREKLEAQARELGLEGDIKFLGTRNDPENFYPALDVVALTSLNEGTPLTLIEAMANARPFIATAVGGVVDLLGERERAEFSSGVKGDADNYQICEHGISVRPNDAEAFCEGLARLIDAEDLRRAMGERGQHFVQQHYSKERLLTDVKNLYRELAEEAAEFKVQSKQPQVKNESSTLKSEL